MNNNMKFNIIHLDCSRIDYGIYIFFFIDTTFDWLLKLIMDLIFDVFFPSCHYDLWRDVKNFQDILLQQPRTRIVPGNANWNTKIHCLRWILVSDSPVIGINLHTEVILNSTPRKLFNRERKDNFKYSTLFSQLNLKEWWLKWLS